MPAPEKRPRLVLDAAAIVASVSPHGAANAAVQLLLLGKCEGYASPNIVDEYSKLSARKSVAKLLVRKSQTAADLERVLARIVSVMAIVEPTGDAPACRDENDRMYLHCAVAARVDYLITNDDDLLVESGNYPFAIVRPAEFLELLRQRTAQT